MISIIFFSCKNKTLIKIENKIGRYLVNILITNKKYILPFDEVISNVITSSSQAQSSFTFPCIFPHCTPPLQQHYVYTHKYKFLKLYLLIYHATERYLEGCAPTADSAGKGREACGCMSVGSVSAFSSTSPFTLRAFLSVLLYRPFL